MKDLENLSPYSWSPGSSAAGEGSPGAGSCRSVVRVVPGPAR